MIGIVNYGTGNIKSLTNILNAIGCDSKLVSVDDEILSCDKIILPGVGAFSEAMLKLKQSKTIDSIYKFVDTGRPILGICLGMQLFFESSDEFVKTRGLGLIEGEVVKFSAQNIKIPHVGWNTIEFLRNFESGYFYFTHSFHVKLKTNQSISNLGTTSYGYDFVSFVEYKNLFGIQAHPEKSGALGMKFFKKFMEL